MEATDDGGPQRVQKMASGHQTDVVIDDFLSSATIHGLHKAAANGSLIRRCVWIILLIGMLTSLSIFTYLEMSMYFRYETSTRTHISMRANLEFPAVTLCNANQVKNSIVDCADLEYLLFQQSELSDSVALPIPRPKNASSISGDDIIRCVRAHSHDLEMFRSCFWEGRLVNCSHIFESSITPMGMCFTFNGVLPQRKSRIHGSVGGLRVLIDIEQYLYFFPEKLQSGIKVILHEPTETPLPQMRSFLVGPGLSAEAVLSRNKRILLPSPHGNCVEKESDVALLARFSKYSNMACLTECYQSAIVSHCTCRHYYVSGPERLCNYDELIDCYKAITDNLTGLLTASRSCRTCPQICTTYTYEWSLSYAQFGSIFVNERLVNASIFPEKSYLSSNYIDLTLFYNSLSETVVEEAPAKMMNDIVGNVGGQMGMFLGASLLSIVELIEFGCLLLAKQRGVSPTSTEKKYKQDKFNIPETTSTKSNSTQENVLHVEDA